MHRALHQRAGREAAAGGSLPDDLYNLCEMPSVAHFNKVLKYCALDSGNYLQAQRVMDLMPSAHTSAGEACFTTALLLLYYFFTTALLPPYYCVFTRPHHLQHAPRRASQKRASPRPRGVSAGSAGEACFTTALQLLYNFFTTALQLIYYCFTTATTALLLCLHCSRVLRLQVLELMSTARVAPDLISYNSLLNIASKGAAAPGNKDWSANGLRVYIYKP